MKFKRQRLFILFQPILLLACLTGTGCVTSRTAGWEDASERGQLSEAEQAETMKKALRHWENRQDQVELRMALEALEQVAHSNPNHLQALSLLSRGYYFLADSHLQDIEEKKKTWETGTTWGERALATHPEFKKKVVDGNARPEDAIGALDEKYKEAIYWTAVNLGKWAKHSGVPTQLKYKGRIREFIQRVEALDADFFYGAPDRYWGVYYAVAPGFAGGSMEKSKEHFDRSLKIEPNYLATHVLLAENYATKKGDRALFKKHLQKVLDADANAIPAIRPENLLEKEKAKKMLADLESYF